MNAPVSVFEHRGRQDLVAYSAGNSLEASTDLATVTRIVSQGLNHMPAFGESLTPAEIGAVSVHVVERLSSASEP